MESKTGITSKILYRVYDEFSNLKQEIIGHNIITTQGDQYLADLMSLTPTRTKITQGSGFLVLGTGFSGVNIKNNSWVNTQVGDPQPLDVTFPKVKGTWGGTNGNITQYQFTFPQGSLNISGINEAVIVSAILQGPTTSCLAYAQISPVVNMSSSDSLVVLWEVQNLGQ